MYTYAYHPMEQSKVLKNVKAYFSVIERQSSWKLETIYRGGNAEYVGTEGSSFEIMSLYPS